MDMKDAMLRQEGDDPRFEVPSTLLSSILQQLELAPEQERPEVSVDVVVANLQAEDWLTRISAVRALERLGEEMPVDLLLSLRNDQDDSVRAAVIHALGKSGQHMPLHSLIEALSDPNWHVRETAVLALEGQGRRVPRQVLLRVLHDPDNTVREAARLALQSHRSQRQEVSSYGKLWEQERMQHRGMKDTSYHYSQDENHSGQMQAMDEQMYGYAAHEYTPHSAVAEEAASYEYQRATPGRWEKLTEYPSRRRSRRVLWIIVPIIAILFFLFGRVSVGMFSNPLPSTGVMSTNVAVVVPEKANDVFALKYLSQKGYAQLAREELAKALGLTTDQVAEQVQQGASISDIANRQGISADALNDAERSVLKMFLNDALKAGDIDGPTIDKITQFMEQNPGSLDKTMTSLFQFCGKNCLSGSTGDAGR